VSLSDEELIKLWCRKFPKYRGILPHHILEALNRISFEVGQITTGGNMAKNFVDVRITDKEGKELTAEGVRNLLETATSGAKYTVEELGASISKNASTPYTAPVSEQGAENEEETKA
jgi:hypothetical protein